MMLYDKTAIMQASNAEAMCWAAMEGVTGLTVVNNADFHPGYPGRTSKKDIRRKLSFSLMKKEIMS
ncbi:MAG: hypothetical protein M0Q91_09115 [Methanoregula sp.]|jgi:hypothetical protein|nr:hypothetical protein [Methanoregula sp.]